MATVTIGNGSRNCASSEQIQGPTHRTSLATARGQNLRLISHAQRLNEMQPAAPSELNTSNFGRARYICEVAQMQIASGMYATAMDSLRDALTLGCKCQWVAISNKFDTSISDPERFLGKLRSCTFLTAAEYRLLKKLIDRERPTDIFAAERFVEAVAKVIDCPMVPSMKGGAN